MMATDLSVSLFIDHRLISAYAEISFKYLHIWLGYHGAQ